MTRIRRASRAAVWVVPAAAGQALNLAALGISVAFQLFAAVEEFVFIMAISSIVNIVSTLNVQSVYPGVTHRRDRDALVSTSLFLTALTAGGLVLAASAGPSEARTELLWIAVTVTVMTANALTSAHLVYRGDYVGVAYSRLAAGATNLALTLAVVGGDVDDAFSLIAAADLALLVASSVMLSRVRPSRARVVALLGSALDVRRVRGTVATHAAATGAGFLAGVAFHASSLVTPLLGSYSQAWAVAIRLSGGISSVGVQILSPRIEATFGKAVRGADSRMIVRLRRGIVVASAAIGVVCGAVVTAWVVSTDILPGSTADRLVFLLGVTCYCISAIYFSVGSRLLVMSGRSTAGLLLFGLKALAAAVAILTVDGLDLILALGVLEVVAVVAYSRQLRTTDPERIAA